MPTIREMTEQAAQLLAKLQCGFRRDHPQDDALPVGAVVTPREVTIVAIEDVEHRYEIMEAVMRAEHGRAMVLASDAWFTDLRPKELEKSAVRVDAIIVMAGIVDDPYRLIEVHRYYRTDTGTIVFDPPVNPFTDLEGVPHGDGLFEDCLARLRVGHHDSTNVREDDE